MDWSGSGPEPVSRLRRPMSRLALPSRCHGTVSRFGVEDSRLLGSLPLRDEPGLHRLGPLAEKWKGEASPQKDFRSPHIAPAKTSRPAIRPTVPPATAIRATPAIPATTAPFRRFACVTL